MSGFVVVLADGRRIEIPREIEAAGPEAIEEYVRAQTETQGRTAARNARRSHERG